MPYPWYYFNSAELFATNPENEEMNYFVSQQQEHDEFHYSTDSEWDRADAYELGELNPDQAWVNTDRDVWHANPFYQGPALPHPEDYEACEGYYVVGQHAVNLYNEHLELRLYRAWSCGNEMVHLWHEANGTWKDLPF